MMTKTDERGLFDRETARQITNFGWWLLGGLTAAALIENAVESLLLGSMIRGETFSYVPFSISGPALLGALGIACIGRVMARASTPQDEVDGTV